MANNTIVSGPNQPWQFDIKHGHIQEEEEVFYFVEFIDVYSKKLISFHLVYNCTALDLPLTLKATMSEFSREQIKKLVIHSYNGSQMSSNLFKESVNLLVLTHEFTPIRWPDKNAYIESLVSGTYLKGVIIIENKTVSTISLKNFQAREQQSPIVHDINSNESNTA